MVQSQVLFQLFEWKPAKNYKLLQFKTQDAFTFASYQKLEVALDAVGTEPSNSLQYLLFHNVFSPNNIYDTTLVTPNYICQIPKVN